MTALHAALTGRAMADGNAKGAHDRAHDRQVFLILRGVTEYTATIRAVRRQRRRVVLIDVRRRRAMRFASVRRAGFVSRATRWPSRDAVRERRGLPVQSALRFVEVVFDPVDLLAQLVAVASIPIAIPISALVLAPQSLDFTALAVELAFLPFELVDQLLAGRRAPSRLHAPVMARLKNLYNYKRTKRRCRRRSATAITR